MPASVPAIASFTSIRMVLGSNQSAVEVNVLGVFAACLVVVFADLVSSSHIAPVAGAVLLLPLASLVLN